MKYILREYPAHQIWQTGSEGEEPVWFILAVGEQEFIRAARKRPFNTRCIFRTDKIQPDTLNKRGLSAGNYKFCHSLEALMADHLGRTQFK